MGVYDFLEQERIAEIENTTPTIREGVWYDENLPYFRLFKATVGMLLLSLYLLSDYYIKTWSF